MTYITNKDFFLEVSKGNVAGHSNFTMRGHNLDIDTAPEEDVWGQGGNIVYLASAETMNIASTNANDTSAGTGARTVLIDGVDGTGAAISEMVTMNGVSNVLTVNSYYRINEMVTLTVGSTGYNEGDIIATASTAATVQCFLCAEVGLSQSAHYTVPLNKSAFLLKGEFNAAKISGGGGSPVVEFRGYVTPFGGSRFRAVAKKLDTGLADELIVEVPTMLRLSARTDIRLTALTDVNNTEVITRIYLIIVDD